MMGLGPKAVNGAALSSITNTTHMGWDGMGMGFDGMSGGGGKVVGPANHNCWQTYHFLCRLHCEKVALRQKL